MMIVRMTQERSPQCTANLHVVKPKIGRIGITLKANRGTIARVAKVITDKIVKKEVGSSSPGRIVMVPLQ